MKDWQRDYVLNTLDELLSSTRCYAMLISTLITKNILDPVDWDMESMKYQSRYHQADKLYDILITRENAYEEVILALHITNQKEAIKTLMKGFEIYKESIPSCLANLPQPNEDIDSTVDFRAPPEGVSELFRHMYSKYYLIISATDVNITEKRIKQTYLSSFPVHFTSNLKQFQLKQMLNFEETQIIVVTCHRKVDFKYALSNLLQQTHVFQTIRIIIITEVTHEDILTLLVEHKIDKERIRIFRDYPKWEDLTETSKSELIKRPILLQGHGIQLQHFCSDENQLKFLSGKILANLINDEEPEFFAEIIQPNPPWYIQRKLHSKRLQVQLKVIKDTTTSDVFVMSNIETNELHNLEESTGLITVKQLSSQRFIISTRVDHFDLMCKNTSSTVHHLHYHKTHFEWLKTRGSISLIQEHTTNSNVGSIDENEFIARLDPLHDPILISDTSGMGKTRLFKSLAIQLKQHHPERLVFIINLSEFMHRLEKLYPEKADNPFQIKDIVNLLVQSKNLYHFFVKKQLMNWLNRTRSTESFSKINCELMFDGFNDILPEQWNLAHKIFTWFEQYKNNFRIWITTRPTYAKDLERTMSVLGHNIQPFDVHEILKVTTNKWTKSASDKLKLSCDETLFQDALKNFAEVCIKKISSTLEIFDHGMMSIPLQCFMFANIYETQALEYATGEVKSIKPSLANPKTIHITHVTLLYAKMLAQKLGVFLKKKSNIVDNRHPVFITMKSRSDIFHFRLSVELFFPKWIEKLKNILPPIKEDDLNEVLSYGIVESYNISKACNCSTPPRFVHRSFAEYFLAQFTTKFISESNKSEDKDKVETQNIFGEFLLTQVLQLSFVSTLKEVIPLFKNTTIVFFMNEIIEQNKIWNHANFLKTSILSYKRAKETVLGSLTSEKIYIFQLLIYSLNENELGKLLSLDNMLGIQILQLIAKHKSSEVLSRVIAIFKFLNISISIENLKKVNRSAAEIGNVEFVNIITSELFDVSD